MEFHVKLMLKVTDHSLISVIQVSKRGIDSTTHTHTVMAIRVDQLNIVITTIFQSAAKLSEVPASVFETMAGLSLDSSCKNIPGEEMSLSHTHNEKSSFFSFFFFHPHVKLQAWDWQLSTFFFLLLLLRQLQSRQPKFVLTSTSVLHPRILQRAVSCSYSILCLLLLLLLFLISGSYRWKRQIVSPADTAHRQTGRLLALLRAGAQSLGTARRRRRRRKREYRLVPCNSFIFISITRNSLVCMLCSLPCHTHTLHTHTTHTHTHTHTHTRVWVLLPFWLFGLSFFLSFFLCCVAINMRLLLSVDKAAYHVVEHWSLQI